MKPGSDKANIQLRHGKDQELQDSVLPGETLPGVELDKIDPAEGGADMPPPAEGGADMPPPDALRPIIPTSAPDEETRAAAETLKVLQMQQPSAGLPEGSNLLTPPGEADYFKGGGLMRLTISTKMENLLCTCLPAICTEHTSGFDLHHSYGNSSPSQSVGRRLDKSQPKRRFAKLAADGFEVCGQTGYQ